MTRPDPRISRPPGDYTVGCGQPPDGVVSGRVCAGTGAELSCQLCPESPNYFMTSERAKNA